MGFLKRSSPPETWDKNKYIFTQETVFNCVKPINHHSYNCLESKVKFTDLSLKDGESSISRLGLLLVIVHSGLQHGRWGSDTFLLTILNFGPTLHILHDLQTSDIKTTLFSKLSKVKRHQCTWSSTLTAARLLGLSSLSFFTDSSSSFFSGVVAETEAASGADGWAGSVPGGDSADDFLISKGASAAGLERMARSSAVIVTDGVSAELPAGTGTYVFDTGSQYR